MHPFVIFLLVLLAVGIIALSISLPLYFVNKKYKNFALSHSEAIKELTEINKHYKFNDIKDYDMEHSYDNENFYDTISTRDYLIYQLVSIQNGVLKNLNNTYGNEIMFDKYSKEVKEKCVLNTFDTNDLLKNKRRLAKVEKKCFGSMIKTPRIEYSISVRLILTDLGDHYIRSKYTVFYPNEIRSLIDRINDQYNGFYRDEEIWKAIVRVERGKVSNKLRFAIYARDGNRCRICGRYSTTDLEIDHIIPIAKGGKTTFDNLQTLCRDCNKRKGSNIEPQRNYRSRR